MKTTHTAYRQIPQRTEGKWTSLLWALLLLPLFSCAQGDSLKADLPTGAERWPYAFLKPEFNVILDSSGQMAGFYSALKKLENGQQNQVRIVHIGDSHLQADFLTGKMRNLFQSKFGCAGRGLIFPYQVARTNTPDDLRSWSNVNWDAKRNVFPGLPLPIGLSGITVRTQESNYVLNLSVNPAYGDCGFNKVTVFTDKGPQAYDMKISLPKANLAQQQYQETVSRNYHTVKSGETLSGIAARYHVSVTNLKTWNGLKSTVIHPGQKLLLNQVTRTAIPVKEDAFRDLGTFDNNNRMQGEYCYSLTVDTTLYSVCIRGVKDAETQTQATVYGVLLENTLRKGILYNMIGVNGAKYEHYNVSHYFFHHLQELKPDLVIISLGTNESIDAGFNPVTFLANVDQFMKLMREHLPNTSVLITCPPEINQRRSTPNPRASFAAEALRGYAHDKGLACWDLHEAMGGKGVMSKWQKAGLAGYDGIHFTRAGYELQADMLYQAILNQYESLGKTRP